MCFNQGKKFTEHLIDSGGNENGREEDILYENNYNFATK
jgi:hypothetical protein